MKFFSEKLQENMLQLFLKLFGNDMILIKYHKYHTAKSDKTRIKIY